MLIPSAPPAAERRHCPHPPHLHGPFLTASSSMIDLRRTKTPPRQGQSRAWGLRPPIHPENPKEPP